MSRAETGKMLRVQHPHCVRLSPGVCSIITQSRCFGCYELRPFRWQLAFLPKLGLDSYRSYCECVNDMSASIWLLLFHQFGMPALERACSPGQHSNPIRVIASILLNAGRKMFPKTWRTNYAAAATCRRETSLFTCKISQINTKAVIMMCNCPCRCQAFSL